MDNLRISLSQEIPGSTEVWVKKDKVCKFDEWGFDDGLTDEVYEWFKENVGPWGNIWNSSEMWMFEDYGMTSICFHFKEANHAVLFKLRWG